MSKTEAKYDEFPKRLPMVRLQDVEYFVDFRLRQFREVTNPHNYIDFDTEKGRQMCMGCWRLECSECGQTAVVPRDIKENEIKCIKCSRAIPIYE